MHYWPPQSVLWGGHGPLAPPPWRTPWMEYLEGGSLADRLKDQKPLPNDATLKYLKQILEGMDFLHLKNIYHSDIKPANILFNERDDVKICDFGIAVGIEWQTESSATASNMKAIFVICLPSHSITCLRVAQQMIYGA